jgi:KipI family sensor histidine kinase inhibitor
MTSQEHWQGEHWKSEHWRIFPCGDAALTIECADDITLEAFETVQSLRQFLESHPIRGVREYIPAFTTLTLAFDMADDEVLTLANSPFEYVCRQIQEVLSAHTVANQRQASADTIGRSVEIPVCYDEVYAPDLRELATERDLSVEEVVRLHTNAEYRVAMLGFTPGFPYLLGLDSVLAKPRKNSPRAHVPAGAVGIAGGQTGIYPFASPGGWNIIGQTPLRLFSQDSIPPTLLKAGDKVRFYRVSRAEFEQLAAVPAATIPATTSSVPTAAILSTGLKATIQDAGRFGWREYGIPQSGAADAYSAALANILVGNARNEAVLEVMSGGFAMHLERDTVIALTGANMSAEAVLGGFTKRVPMCRPILMRRGVTLRMRNADNGFRSYIALAGGIDTPLSLGSRSTYQRAGLGGICGRALVKGDVIACGKLTAQNASVMRFFPSVNTLFPQSPFLPAKWFFRSEIAANTNTLVKLRVVLGAEYDELTPASKHGLFTQQLRVLPNSDRMGLRLSVPQEQAFVRSTEKQVISRAVMPGTVQLPPDGQPIVLLADSQTTGGYPVIAHVSSVDLPRAAQLRPNDQIIFEEITLEEAQKLYIERVRLMNVLEKRIQSW